MVCINSQTCQTCISNYTLSTDKTSCTCSINNCLQCSPTDGLCDQNTKSSCQQCVGLYIKDNNNQYQCPIKNCSVCNQNRDQCLTCIQGYQLSSGNTLYNCSIKNCQKCSQTDRSVCQDCQNGSFEPATKTCQCLVSNCSLCNQNTNSQCQQCIGLYVKDSNGQCQCPIKNCAACNTNGDKYLTCIQGYQLSNGNTECNCSVQNCLQCIQTEGSIYQDCQNGKFDPTTKACLCLVQNCSFCDQNSNSSCKTCSGLYIKNTQNQCQCQTQNCSSQPIVASQEDVHNFLNLQIEDYDNPFVVNILSIQEKQISAQLKLKDNCKNKNLIVKLNNHYFLQINSLKYNQKEVKLKQYIILSQNQVAQAQKTGEVTKGAVNTLLITMILMIIIGNTYVLFRTIDLTTFIQFLLFVDIRHPENLLSFCSIFQNFQFAFVPNTIQLYLIEPNYVYPKIPQKFLENGYDAPQNVSSNKQIHPIFYFYGNSSSKVKAFNHLKLKKQHLQLFCIIDCFFTKINFILLQNINYVEFLMSLYHSFEIITLSFIIAISMCFPYILTYLKMVLAKTDKILFQVDLIMFSNFSSRKDLLQKLDNSEHRHLFSLLMQFVVRRKQYKEKLILFIDSSFINLFTNSLYKWIEIVYYQDFTSNPPSCYNLFSQYWSIVSGTFSGGCQYQCDRSDNGNSASMFSPDMSSYSNGSQMIKPITKPYSFFGIDLVYLRKDDPFTMSIYDGNTNIFSQDYYGASTGTNIEYNYSLECSVWSGYMQVSKEIVQLNQSLTSNSINVRILQHVTNAFSWYGVLKLTAWANCVENCDVCLDNTNCSSCIQGFDRYTLPSGQKVCEQTYNCNISNCFSCIESSPSSLTATCVKCLPGFTLDANSNCVPNSGGACASNKYQSTVSGCQSYSTQCYMQKQNTYYTWQTCPGQVNLSQYKCSNNQSILIYEHKNYSLYTCGCPVNNCIQCPNPSQCSQCQLGFTYDPVSKTCTFVTCPVLYTQDPQTGLCNKNCSGNDCQQCDQNQQCTVCNPSGNFYIVAANPVNCAICTISNCSICSGEGLCQQCQTNFTLSPDRSACNPCSVSNCGQCVIGQSTLCQTCLPGYIQSLDNTTCSCSAQNCSVCNSQDGTKCDLCTNGYLISLDKKQCSCVVPSCSQCTPLNGSKCQTCISGYNLNPLNSQCICNVSNCQTCNSSNGNLCDSCITNYAPAGIQSSTCTCQVYGCQACTPLDGLICQTCQSNFTFQSGSCQCNVQNCSLCSATDGSKCNTCVNNYLLNASNTSCDCQVNSCNQCDISNGKICVSPKPGYTYDPLSQTNKCNFPNCQKCDPNDGNICLQCQNGYIFNSNQCKCNVQYCQKCDSLNGNVCLLCITEYHLNPVGQSVQCQLNCSLDNCKECQDPPNNKTQCKTCNSGYVLDPSTNQCVSTQCKVPKCNQCQPYKPNMCQICSDQYNLDSNSSQCVLSIKNDFFVQQTVIQNVGYNVTLIFQNQIVIQDQNFDSQLKIQIEDYANPFQVSILQVQEKSIKLQIKLSDNCKNKNLVVQMNDPSFVRINNLVDPQKEVKLNEYVILSESQIQQSQQTKQVASGASSSLLIMVILMIVIGNTYVLFSTIDLTTFIYFMLFIDVRYPDNVMSFCSIFQNFQFAFIPNSIQVYLLDPNYTQPYTPKKFLDNGYDAYFFNGAGQSFTIITSIMTIYGIIKILSYIPVTSIRVYIRSKIKSGWEYCGFFDLVGCVYVYLLISCLLQFYRFQFDESLAFINYTLFSLTFVFIIIYPIMITIFIKKCKNLNEPQIQMQFGSIIGGLVLPKKDQDSEEQDKKQQNNLNESNLKTQNESKSLQKIEFEKLNRQKYLQYKWSRYTNEEKSANIKNGISEVLLVVMQITICFLVKDDDSQREEDRFNIGWIIVGSASLILTIHIFSVVIDLLKGIYNLVKDFICTLIKPKAEIEKLKQEKLAEEQNKQNKFLRLASQISIDKLRSMKKKLSLVPQSQLDLSMVSTQRHQTKQKQILIQPKKIESNQFIELQNPQENFDQANKSSHKNEENQIQKNENKNSSFELKNSPGHEKINLQNSFIHNNINNQNTHKILFSAPQSINISNNDLLAAKNTSQVFL
ncbi:hypothetical protein ABPG72_008866 [Tetrahymena utriculariae]